MRNGILTFPYKLAHGPSGDGSDCSDEVVVKLAVKLAVKLVVKLVVKLLAYVSSWPRRRRQRLQRRGTQLRCFASSKVQILTPELLRFGERRGGAQFTCCTGTKVQILTPEVLQQEEYQEPVELRLLLQMDVALNEQLRAQEHRFSFFCVRRSTGSRSCARTRACHQDAVGAGISIARKPNVLVIYISTNIQATQVCGRRR